MDQPSCPAQIRFDMACVRKSCVSLHIFMQVKLCLDNMLRRDESFNAPLFSRWFRFLIQVSRAMGNPVVIKGMFQQVTQVIATTGDMYPQGMSF